MNGSKEAALHFNLKGRITDIRPFGSGNINQTFLLCTDATPPEQFIIQKLNRRVFRQPRQVIENMAAIIRHMASEIDKQDPDHSSWCLPTLLETRDGQTFHIDAGGDYWRAVSYLDQTISFEAVQNSLQAEKAGRALGRFHQLTSNLDPGLLHDTLPGFHHTPGYVLRYDQVRQAADGGCALGNLSEYCADIIATNRETANILENAHRIGKLRIRTIHGDPKISNMLFSAESGEPVSMVDLDTVKPGLIQYDIGDFFRSICNPAGEETIDPEAVRFDNLLFEAGLAGYFSEMGPLLRKGDIEMIFDAIRLMTLELGLRFFTDFLEGDVYFKAQHQTHNLMRATVQFKLLECILEGEKAIRAFIDRIAV